jgi:hypothetical protein
MTPTELLLELKTHGLRMWYFRMISACFFVVLNAKKQATCRTSWKRQLADQNRRVERVKITW